MLVVFSRPRARLPNLLSAIPAHSDATLPITVANLLPVVLSVMVGKKKVDTSSWIVATFIRSFQAVF